MDIALLGAVLAAYVLCLLEKKRRKSDAAGHFTKPARLSAGRLCGILYFV